MLKLEEFTPHLTAYGVTSQISHNRRLETPDELVTVREFPGPPHDAIEGAIDIQGLHITVRGPREEQYTARDTMHLVHRFMMDENLWPYFCGTTKVFNTGPMGGGPAFLETDEFNRSVYVCTYWARVSR